jgi:hypothetical protein
MERINMTAAKGAVVESGGCVWSESLIDEL